jgi:hypothetical protein
MAEDFSRIGYVPFLTLALSSREGMRWGFGN